VASKRKPKPRRKPAPAWFKCPQCRGYLKVADRKSHACEPPTEQSLTAVLSEDGREAWAELRRFATSLGPQRVYASAKAIMFARRICYFFVRPKARGLVLCFFLDRPLQDAAIRRLQTYGKSKHAHLLTVSHRDQVEEPLTDWLREAWELPHALSRGRVLHD
jgi:hypothetical protein